MAAAMLMSLGIDSAAKALEVEVEIEDFTFIPHGSVINVGDTIKWRNRDLVQHTSTSDAGVWNSGLLSRDQEFSFVFTSPGTYPYHCTPHPTMRDTIFVLSPTGAEDRDFTPIQFELAQNYPNPFNAKTTIKFGLPNAAHVELTIFDILGRTISTLADDNFEAGFHSVVWDAGNSPSGVYFYKFSTPEYQATRRLLLMK